MSTIQAATGRETDNVGGLPIRPTMPAANRPRRSSGSMSRLPTVSACRCEKSVSPPAKPSIFTTRPARRTTTFARGFHPCGPNGSTLAVIAKRSRRRRARQARRRSRRSCSGPRSSAAAVRLANYTTPARASLRRRCVSPPPARTWSRNSCGRKSPAAGRSCRPTSTIPKRADGHRPQLPRKVNATSAIRPSARRSTTKWKSCNGPPAGAPNVRPHRLRTSTPRGSGSCGSRPCRSARCRSTRPWKRSAARPRT